MTGTNLSEYTIRLLAAAGLLAVAAAWPARADQLQLTGGERISGTVSAINPDGTVVLETPLSPEPLRFKAGSVREVKFTDTDAAEVTGRCLVTLANGDALPGVIEEIDGQNLTMAGGGAGRMVVPRAVVASLMPGLNHPQVVLSGPDGFDGWKRNPESAEQWAVEQRAFRVEGASSISRKPELPEQFVVRFKLAWRNNPKFKFSFAADDDQEGEAQDRYYLQFNSGGLEIKRESATDKRYHSLVTLNRLPQQFKGRQVTFEIRVDRRERVLELWLNGEPEGKFKDPLSRAPEGGFLVFASDAGEDEMQTISDIEVTEWSPQSGRGPVGERGDKTKDALLGAEGERFSGKLERTKKGDDGLLYVFKNAFQENAIEVPEDAIAAIYLAETPEGAASRDKGIYSLRLQDGGLLRVSECVFAGDEVTVVHPLLGKMKLKRTSIVSFEHKETEPGNSKKKP